MQFFIVFLNVNRQAFEEGCVHVEKLRATFVRTVNFLKGFDLIYDVMMQAGFAKVGTMFALAHKYLFVLVFRLSDFSFADFAKSYILDLVHCTSDPTADNTANLRLFDFLLRFFSAG